MTRLLLKRARHAFMSPEAPGQGVHRWGGGQRLVARGCAGDAPAAVDREARRNRILTDPDINSLMRAASERQLAVAALQKKYERSESIPTEQLVLDMRELLSTERVVLDAIITLFVKLGHGETHGGP
jgi:hypothetical protein